MDCIRPSLLQLQPYDAVVPQTADKVDANEHPNDLPDWFKQKLSLIWEKGIPSNRYPDASHRSLKQAIARYTGSAPEHISLGNGSDELIRSLFLITCLENRGGILVAEPTFSMYRITAETLGIPVTRVPRDPQTMALDLETCQAAVETGSVRVICLVSPNSPTGNSITAAEWDWIRTIPPQILVIIDEAYYEFAGQTAIPELAHHRNWVVLRTFSKAFRLATHRVGYAIGDPQLIQALEVTRLPYNLPMMSQWAVQLALEHADDLLASVPDLLRERDRLYQALSPLPGIQLWPSVANFLYFRVDGWDLGLLQRELLLQGTCVRHTGDGIRLSVGTPAENQRVIQRLHTLLVPAHSAQTPAYYR